MKPPYRLTINAVTVKSPTGADFINVTQINERLDQIKDKGTSWTVFNADWRVVDRGTGAGGKFHG